jgi:hypothetical protein
MKYYAAIKVNGRVYLVPSRKHVYHPNHSAAFRAIERYGKRLNGGRGFIWPVDASSDSITLRLASGEIPSCVETVAV